jgi:hypothetical protein
MRAVIRILTGDLMKFFSSLFAILLMSLSGACLAEKVTPIGVGCDTESGECFIILKEKFTSQICEGGGNNQLRLQPTKAGTTGQYSAALAAYMGGKRLEAGSNSCFKNQVTPSYLYVID